MTYQEAISLLQIRYARWGYDKQLPKLTDEEALTELSVAQADIQNRYMVTQKKVTVTLVSGQYVYVEGSGVSNIPYDIGTVISVWLNDALNTNLLRVSFSSFLDFVRASGTPYSYAILDTAYGTKELHLDCLPSQAWVLSMLYAPKYDIYMGVSGSNANTALSDYANKATGVFKLPPAFHPLVVEGALAAITRDSALTTLYTNRLDDMASRREYNTSNDIPYDNSAETSGNQKLLQVGQDPRRNFYG